VYVYSDCICIFKEVKIEKYVKLRSTEKLQNLNLKIREYNIYKTEMDNYKNNKINRLEFIQIFGISSFLPQ